MKGFAGMQGNNSAKVLLCVLGWVLDGGVAVGESGDKGYGKMQELKRFSRCIVGRSHGGQC